MVLENVTEESPTPDQLNLVEAVDPIVNSGGTVASELPERQSGSTKLKARAGTKIKEWMGDMLGLSKSG